VATVHKDVTPTKLDRSISVQQQVAELRRGCGDHMSAIQMLDRALAAAPPHNRIELLFLRGALFVFVLYTILRTRPCACGAAVI
jgi:hypothetical protein